MFSGPEKRISQINNNNKKDIVLFSPFNTKRQDDH